MEYPSQYEKLQKELEETKSKLIDLMFEMNYNKQTELIEFVRSLYESTFDKNVKKFSKSEILLNLRESIEEFARNNNINITD